MDDRKESPTYKQINTFVLSQLNPSVLVVPTGIYTGWMSLDDKTVIIGISTEPFDKNNPDDERLDPFTYGNLWEIKHR